ncbi:hypothetical protein [Caballeronia sp. KNU42]
MDVEPTLAGGRIIARGTLASNNRRGCGTTIRLFEDVHKKTRRYKKVWMPEFIQHCLTSPSIELNDPFIGKNPLAIRFALLILDSTTCPVQSVCYRVTPLGGPDVHRVVSDWQVVID